jgi:flagellar biosynthesis chaperone FliJ
MKRFRFPLDAVLRWRETALEQEEAKLQSLFAEEQRILGAIEQTRAEGAAAERSIREQREMVSTDLRSLAAFRLHLEQRLKTLAQRRADQTALIEQQRRAVLEAERRFQLMVKLRNRRLAEWQYEATRESEMFSQEAFLGRWGVRKRVTANDSQQRQPQRSAPPTSVRLD